MASELDAHGCAVLERLLAPEACAALAALYPDDGHFRSRVVMGRHGFGRGEYKYFSYPLPEPIAGLRTALYARLSAVANRWNEAMRIDVRYPAEHRDFLARCHAAGQRKPTPLLLQYGPDDFNCLHQDLYGEHVFPIQVAILLSEPGRDFSGRRVRPHRAASADAVAGGGRAAPAGRRGRVRGASPAGAGDARRVPGEPAARREPHPVGAAAHGGDHLP